VSRGHKKCDRCNEFKRTDKTVKVGHLDYCKHCYSYLKQLNVLEYGGEIDYSVFET